ncbi:hypothetical protein EJ03DRAFT_466 [Teratosphaeria nubilosa]|uniref:Uncharacterized protein n=1 Tax=Teratosphaeria nubilosa TaxID=161662 RepID=A0A6G1LNU7_9PEZI|nr:hypothetical protein EJ03DRAFT_466 [Teratosphaeria nubilosa]
MATEEHSLSEVQSGQHVFSGRSSTATECLLDAAMALSLSEATDEQATTGHTRCRLLELAAELRNNIYELAVQESDAIDINPDVAPKRHAEPALSMTCRQIRRESLPLFYDVNVFSYQWQPRTLSRTPKSLIANMSNMKHLELHVCRHENHYELHLHGGVWELSVRIERDLGLVCLVNDEGLAKGKSYLKRVHKERGGLVGLEELEDLDDVIQDAYPARHSQRSV